MLIIFAAAFVCAALIFGVVFGIIIAVDNASAIASYGGVNIDEETAKYLSSYHKYTYIAYLRSQKVEAYDDPEFWYSSNADGITYGRLLTEGARAFISDVLVSNYYFDKYSSLDSSAKAAIEAAVEAVEGRFYSDGAALNEALAKRGLTRRGLERAAEMIYKTAYAQTMIYGDSGAKLMNADYFYECERYLAEYSRVKLLFIRTENTFELDENGKRLQDSGGYKMRELSVTEKSERAALMEKIDAEIAGYKSGADIQITEELFEGYIKKQGEGDPELDDEGYYFSKASAYTAAFASDVSEDIVRTALDIRIGDYAKVETEFAVCYLYRCEPATGAYLDTSETGFFADFYSDAADFLFVDTLDKIRGDVVFNDKLSDADIIGVGYDSDLYMRY